MHIFLRLIVFLLVDAHNQVENRVDSTPAPPKFQNEVSSVQRMRTPPLPENKRNCIISFGLILFFFTFILLYSRAEEKESKTGTTYYIL